MEIEMVLCQICKDSRAKTDLVGAVEHQRVGRDLHNDVRAACIAHIGKELLQLKGLRRGALGVQDLIADHILIVPMRPTFAPSVFSSTCFSRYVLVVLPFVPVIPTTHIASAGWPNQFAPSAASAERALETSTYGMSVSGFFFADDADRAVFHGLGNIFVAVGLEAGDRDKQCSGRYLPGVILNAGNIQCFVRMQFQHVKAVQQFF